MATRLAESLIGAEAAMLRIHRRVVRVGAAAAWFAAAIFMVAGFFTGNEELFGQAVGPILAAGLMTALIVLRRENAGIAMVGSGFVVMVWFTVVGNHNTIVPAAVSLVVICAIGMLFVERRQNVIIAGVGLFLFSAPQFWSLAFGESLLLGIVMALSFVMTSVIFTTVRDAATTLNVRFQMLFEHSPTAVMEEDWSGALAYVLCEYTGRPDRIRAFLLAYPAVVRRAIAKARIIRVNSAAVELLEAESADALLGYRDGNKVTQETLEGFVEALVALYEGKTFYEQELPALTMKGRPIWLQARSVDTSSGQPGSTVLIGLADITHIKARQEAMAQMVRAKDEFIARVSHELRTPLTAVLGLTSEMSSENSLSESERAELMHLVSGQAEEMAHIVDDLLVAARADTGRVSLDLGEVEMDAALKATLDGLAMRIDDLPESIPTVFADPSRVRQILRNLLTNAERYGGPERRVLAGALFDNVWIEVRDSGEGVPADAAERIFEPYGTAHSGFSASVGLGLSVARQLAEMMGGSLTYHRDGSETIFRLELPAGRSTKPALTTDAASV